MTSNVEALRAARASVLGVGAVGAKVAEALLATGAMVTVWNRTPGRADTLVGRGAVPADSAAEAATASPLVILCVTNYQAANSGTSYTPPATPRKRSPRVPTLVGPPT